MTVISNVHTHSKHQRAITAHKKAPSHCVGLWWDRQGVVIIAIIDRTNYRLKSLSRNTLCGNKAQSGYRIKKKVAEFFKHGLLTLSNEVE